MKAARVEQVNPAQAQIEAWERGRAAARLLEHAVLGADLVRLLRVDFGLTQSLIGDAVGASERSVRTWESPAANVRIRQVHRDRLRDLSDVVVILSSTLTPAGIGEWLAARQRRFDDAPAVDLIAAGHVDDVELAARELSEGGYA